MPPSLIGHVLDGKFRLDEVVGAGSMGTVYRATQLTLSKTVAIKVMNRDLAKEANYASRFKREAKAASRFDHPNSVRVVDFGEDGGILYMAMEFLNGRDLLSVITDDWPLAPARIVDLMSQTLAPLALAHEMGIIHRDLKPENVMVLRGKNDEGNPTELVKVCDFGVAKLLPNRSGPDEDAQGSTATGTLTATGMMIGTPEYMSPEQVSGMELDARSDLYSLGVILYQILTRTLPFEDKSPLKLAMKQISETPKPPSAVATGVDPRLEAICLKAMSKDPEDRFASAREMRSELRGGGAKDSFAHIAGSLATPPSTRIVPASSGAPNGDPLLFSRAETIPAGPPGSPPARSAVSSKSRIASPRSAPKPAALPTQATSATLAVPKAAVPARTATEPSAQELKRRALQTWLALGAIALVIAVVLFLAR